MNIINLRNYGDIENIKKDSVAINDIIDRQGIKFLNDVIATYVGEQNIKFNFSVNDVNRLKDFILKDLREQINERT